MNLYINRDHSEKRPQKWEIGEFVHEKEEE